MSAGIVDGQAWLDSLPDELAGQRRVLTGLLAFCRAAPQVTSLNVGCSLGRGTGDALSDIDAALGLAAGRGQDGAAQILAASGKFGLRLACRGASAGPKRP